MIRKAVCALLLGACAPEGPPEVPVVDIPVEPVSPAASSNGPTATPRRGPPLPGECRDPERWRPRLEAIAKNHLPAAVTLESLQCRGGAETKPMQATFTMQPGQCYALVALSAYGQPVLEVKANGVGGLGGLPKKALAVGENLGEATLIGADACFRNPLPFVTPAKVSATQTSALAIYSRPF